MANSDKVVFAAPDRALSITASNALSWTLSELTIPLRKRKFNDANESNKINFLTQLQSLMTMTLKESLNCLLTLQLGH